MASTLAVAWAGGACGIVAPLDQLSGGISAAGDGTPGDGDAAAVSFMEGGSEGEDGPMGTDDAAAGDAALGRPRDAATAPEAAADAPSETTTAREAAADACVPTALACDGTAHACDGVVDEGCPSALTIGAPGALQFLGGNATGGMPFDDACPAGQVLVGVGGATGQWIDAVYGICGAVALHTVKSSDPYAYSVTISPGTTLPTRGTVGSSDVMWQATCPADQAVVQVAGKSGVGMDQVTLSCAPLAIGGSPGAFVLQHGGVTVLPPQGDTGGGPFTPVACPDPQVITAVGGGAGQWVDSMSIACGAPTLTLVR